MHITNDIVYVGVNDRSIDLFEGQYVVKNGMCYNSYVILDDKIAVMDTVDARFGDEWLANLKKALGARTPDYLIVQHMEPDHSANILNFALTYPKTAIVANAKTFVMMDNFFEGKVQSPRITVVDGGELPLGKRSLHFVFAPMVHWPEVMVTYDDFDKVLFSADGFGKFGAMDAKEDWTPEARRYYIGIVGKYGAQVQNLLKKAATLDIAKICPLHGPVLTENLGKYLSLYDTWSSYGIESEGVMIAYTSVYGHTKAAAELLAESLRKKHCPKVALYDLARTDMSLAVAEAFRYGKLVLATTTYNAEIFPYMREFIDHLTERNFQNRTVGLIENGSWAPLAVKVMKAKFEKSKNITWVEPTVRILSALSDENRAQIEDLATVLCTDYLAAADDTADKQNMRALYKIGYGLYVITSNDGTHDNGLIVNTVTQVTDDPKRIAVTINKRNYSHDVIKATGIFNINCLSVDAPFSVFEHFGFQSGRDVDKFADETPGRTQNGLVFLSHYINAVMSIRVEEYIDLGSHGLFIGAVEEARVMSDKDTMTYAFYQANVKPKPEAEGKKGFVCKVCCDIYEGDKLPDDFICPLCKHGASDFEPLK